MSIRNRIVEIAYDLKDRFTNKIGSITGGMKEIEQASTRSAKKIEQNNRGITSSFGSIGGAVSKASVGILALVATVGKLVSSAGQWIEAAAIQERAEKKLETTLRNLSGASAAEIQALKDQAAALQEVTGYGDEATISAQAMLGTFQLTADQIAQLTPRLLDMAEASRKTGSANADLETIAVAIGKAFTSGIGSLSRYGVAMTDAQKEAFKLASQQEKVKILVEVLDGNFEGLAAAVGNTYEGAMRKADSAQGDFLENLGKLFTQNEAWIDLMKVVTRTWQSMSDGISGSSDNMRLVIGTLAKTLAVLAHTVRTTWNVIQSAFRVGAAGVVSAIGSVTSALSLLTFGEASKRLSQFASDMRGTAREILKGVETDWADIKSSTEGLLQVFDETGMEARSLSGELGSVGREAATTASNTNELKKKSDDLKKSLEQASQAASKEVDDLNKVRDAADDTREKFQRLKEEMQGGGGAETSTNLFDVVKAMNQARESLNEGDFDGAIKGAEGAAEKLRALKESGDQGLGTLTTIAMKLQAIAEEASQGKIDKELIQADESIQEVDKIKAKIDELESKSVSLKVDVDSTALDQFTKNIKPIEIPVVLKQQGGGAGGLDPSSFADQLAEAANKGGK